MNYAEVILPLPLDGVYTYAVPDAIAPRVVPGARVQVPLGRSKVYTGVVLRTTATKPDFDVREVMAAPDDGAVLLPIQLRLWQWIASYYMAPLGDVYTAALPAGLKADDSYRPRMETYIGLAEAYRTQAALHVAFQITARATKQRAVLAEFLRLTHWDAVADGAPGAQLREITREELRNACHTTDAVVKALVDRKILYIYKVEVGRLNQAADTPVTPPMTLSPAQQAAYDGIVAQMQTHEVVLLHGVTSSGKTEVYIHLIARALELGQQVLYLLPEIALTVQMMDRLRRVFGSRLGIYHSKYSDAERVEIWKKQLSAHPYDVILGARSAVFLPFQRLGLVVIDEEHETSFKQQDPAPRYHARSVAIMLAHLSGARTLLGTATPSAESYHNALTGKFGLVRLTTRYQDIRLPEIRVVDVRDLRRRKMMRGPFSPDLLAAVRAQLAQGKQAILFQNRRGFAPMVECHVCGWVPKCDNCDVSLTLHKTTNRLTCHYCGFTYTVPTECPCCGSRDIQGRGYGTEKIEDAVREAFPEARVARMDLDTTRTRNAYERIIADFAQGRTNVLIGTQMVSKGLDFDRVGVVGILDADSMLNYPDFRAYEHAFMMMAQVSGRAGRKGGQGLVILQTRQPELPVIQQVVRHDFEGFYRGLMAERQLFRYPPFGRLIYVYIKHKREPVADTAAIMLASMLRQWFGDRVLGPDKPAVARIKTLTIRKIVLKLENGLDAHRVREYLRLAQKKIMQDKQYATLQIYYDVDPV
ncbi:MAG: primosomal protein N' [Prevotella sp.]|nr:primosomal protein N' [Prevotella sp.]MDY3248126.1 primosomal protein N' [Prevotella sp.]